MKYCPKCDETKPASAFYKDRSTRSGLASICKDCQRLWRQSAASKASQKRYKQSAKGKASEKRHKKGEAGKAARKRYEQSPIGKEAARRKAKRPAGVANRRRNRRSPKGLASAKRQREREPQKHKARGDVNNAVAADRIPRISTQECADCGNQAEQYHHSDYTKTLDVTPLCRECHSKRHC